MYNEFDKRMKGYENNNKLFLQKKTPVIIRIDGKAFHSFTKGLDKPFDAILGECMAKTTEYLLNNISGCVFGYTQSDEISLLLVDYQTEGTEPWFDNNQQKLVSISAAMATLTFNRFFNQKFGELCHELDNPSIVCGCDWRSNKEIKELQFRVDVLENKVNTAMFDARAFNIPKEEVLNYFIWRQQDATKNSISMLAQAHFSHKALQGKNGSQMQDMLMLEKGINWNDIPTKFKRGVAVYKKGIKLDITGFVSYKIAPNGSLPNEVIRNKSYIDYEMPILTQDREFIKGY